MRILRPPQEMPRRPEDIEAPPKIAYDENGQELIETMKLLPANSMKTVVT